MKFLSILLLIIPLFGDWELLQYQLTNNGFMDAEVEGNHIAWLCGVQDNVGGVVWKTTDGGNTWTGNGVQIGDMMWTHGLQFFDSLHGVVSGYYINIIFPFGCIYYTNDGGNSWSEASVSGSTLLTLFTKLHFCDSQHGWVIGTPNKIYQTNDGGLNWNQISSIDTTYPLRNIFFLDTSTGWVCGGTTDTITYIAEKGIIAKTTDGGNTWVNQIEDYPLEIEAIHFTDQNNGWAVAYKDTASSGVFLHTTDGGTNWVESYGPPGVNGNYGLYDVKFFDTQEGWAVGGGDISGWQNNNFAIFLHTTDGGQTWTSQEIYPGSLPGAAPFAFDINDSIFGIAGGSHLSIYRFPVGGPGVAENHKKKLFYLSISPNPFRYRTTIKYTGPYSNTASILIFDSAGRIIKSFNKNINIWDGTDNNGAELASGVYFVRLNIKNYQEIKKVSLIR